MAACKRHRGAQVLDIESPPAGRLVGTRVSRRVERALTRPSLPLNDEDCFVVNVILFSNLPQMVVVFSGVFHQRIADVSR